MEIITEEKLKEEAAKYGAAGPDAQVIWPNGVLASTAVGLFVQLVISLVHLKQCGRIRGVQWQYPETCT